MARVAAALADLTAARGAVLRYGARVSAVGAARGRARRVTLDGGEVFEADAIVSNGDAAALGAGLLGADCARAVPAVPPRARSLSALTFAFDARVRDFPLSRHNVFFCADYAAEFADIFGRARLPRAPTVYVCAQDRSADAADSAPDTAPQRLFCLVNAPASDDAENLSPEEIDRCKAAAFGLLTRCGLAVTAAAEQAVVTTPARFAEKFPGSGGALYGRASHGWTASFSRPGSRTALPGLYLAGGSAHPGPGVPMAAQSGRLAAAAVAADLGLT